MASFPTSIVANTDPTSGNTLNNPDHAGLHSSHNAEIAATETKLGTGVSAPASNTFLIGTGTGTSSWTAVTSAQIAARVTDETGSGALVFGTSPALASPTISSPNITTPTISTPVVTGGGSFASPVLTTPQVITSINDSNGNEIIKTPATASAVNEFTITNAATGANPVISATGNDAVISPNIRGKGVAGKVTVGAGATQLFPYDYVVSGCIITADSVGVNKNYSVSSGVVVIGGVPLTVAAVSAQTVTASKDRYVDATDNGDGTAVLSTTAGEVANNAASFALPANSIRIGIVVAGATTIATTGSINQGQESALLPIASSTPYAVSDSLGNLICPRDPHRKLLGYRELASNFSVSSTTVTQVTGLTCPVIIPTGRKVKISFFTAASYSGTAGKAAEGSIWEGAVVSGTKLVFYRSRLNDGFATGSAYIEKIRTPSSTSVSYSVGLCSVDTAVNTTIETTAYIKVELE